ncbi:MAG: dephospho-CoA kinase [Taibaiella sp.]|nr:dephospho-CoA kinase [Taibaiella sp.]
MLKVGITGGIGSGKSLACRVFATLGIPIFYADDAARHLMEHDTSLRQSIIQLLGPESYTANKPNRERIAAIVFSNPERLKELNSLVHPATIGYANEWIQRQTSHYIIKEAAIFFESGSYTEMDVMIGVFAPQELRIARTMKRSNLSREKVLTIIARQMNEDEKMKRCNHVIVNDDIQALLPQVLHLHELLLKKKQEL